jgi:CheY-like chemotaxis protein
MLDISPARRVRIAVIDDDDVFLELMRDLLGVGEGLDVHTSTDWVGSFELIQDVRPDLVILDLMMGREERGWAVIEALRSQAATRDIPIILCSAAGPAVDVQAERVRDLGAVEVVRKPFDVDHLLNTIYRHVPTIA